MFAQIKRRLILGIWFVIFSFMMTSFNIPPANAQEVFLPAAGTRVALSPAFTPAIIRGMTIDVKNPFAFSFLVDRGDSPLPEGQKKEAYEKLIKYFLSAMTIAEDKQWVNLSPYEKNRIVDADFGKTEMGRDLLAQDYMLKQITASLIYPEEQIGKEFWQRVYKQAAAKFGTTQIPVNTFNKVWIMPDTADVYEKNSTVLVVESKLKVMLEEDYVALNKAMPTGGHVQQEQQNVSPSQLPSNEASNARAPQGENQTHSMASQIVRELILPALTKEVNEGKNFANLRQIYNSMILAAWYKQALKQSILAQVYANKSKVSGVDLSDPLKSQQEIYQQYLKAFKKGAYNFIKEEQDPVSGQMIPRKYFSGGWTSAAMTTVLRNVPQNMAARGVGQYFQLDVANAMVAPVQQANVFAPSKAMTTSPLVKEFRNKNYFDILQHPVLLNKIDGQMNKQLESAIRAIETLAEPGKTFTAQVVQQAIKKALSKYEDRMYQIQLEPRLVFKLLRGVILQHSGVKSNDQTLSGDLTYWVERKTSSTLEAMKAILFASETPDINAADDAAMSAIDTKVIQAVIVNQSSTKDFSAFLGILRRSLKDTGKIGDSRDNISFAEARGLELKSNILSINGGREVRVLKQSTFKQMLLGGLSAWSCSVIDPSGKAKTYFLFLGGQYPILMFDDKGDNDNQIPIVPQGWSWKKKAVVWSTVALVGVIGILVGDGIYRINKEKREGEATTVHVSNGNFNGYVSIFQDMKDRSYVWDKAGKIAQRAKDKEQYFTSTEQYAVGYIPVTVTSDARAFHYTSMDEIRAKYGVYTTEEKERIAREEGVRFFAEGPEDSVTSRYANGAIYVIQEAHNIRYTVKEGGPNTAKAIARELFGDEKEVGRVLALNGAQNIDSLFDGVLPVGTLVDMIAVPHEIERLKGKVEFFHLKTQTYENTPAAESGVNGNVLVPPEAPGGIDLNSANLNMRIKRDGAGVPLPLGQQDPAMLNAPGFVPVIWDIRPAVNVPLLSELKALAANPSSG